MIQLCFHTKQEHYSKTKLLYYANNTAKYNVRVCVGLKIRKLDLQCDLPGALSAVGCDYPSNMVQMEG